MAFDQLAQEAQRRGRKVLTHGVDHTIGEDTWFYVSESGETESTTEPEMTGYPLSSARPSGEAVPDAPGYGSGPETGPKPLPTASLPPLPSTDPEPVAPQAPAVPKPDRAPLQPPPDIDADDRTLRETVTGRAAAQEDDVEFGKGADKPTPTRASRRAETTAFVKPTKDRPSGGLRGAVYKASGGTVNLGPSARQREDDALEKRISRQLHGAYNTAVLSLKGGIGKTSTTVGVGMTLAEFRGDPPCAIDANPDSGDLAERALGESIYQSSSPRTVSDIIDDLGSITSLTELSRYMQHAGRFHVLAGEQEPEVSDSLTAEEYLKIRALIGKYYSVLLTDCGTGVTHNAMKGILQTADNLVIAAGYAVSGAKRARSTLLWLASHGYEELARNAIVVITDKDEVSARVNKDAINEHLSGICRELIAVPHDRGVADGDLISLETLKPSTRPGIQGDCRRNRRRLPVAGVIVVRYVVPL
ncbi:MinD/ParA family ATP-binding protein [Arthrobacter sp. H14]|uniref:MinD/ParA family ATP-binding protein n=1 Tax=Arthrobacter sp. H14 TaxID=1312959 RepID=UPI0020A6D571|nr:MinD/ParA family protein [Arthrobacter sp. H14]